MTPDHREIAKRAYTLWEIEGRPAGRALDHWLRAEAEVHAEYTKSIDDTPGKVETAENALTPVKRPRPAARRARRTQ